MKAKIYIHNSNFVVKATPMMRCEFAQNYPYSTIKYDNSETIDTEGFECDWNGYKFWVEKDWFNNNYTEHGK